MTMRPLRVIIDARMPGNGTGGGVQLFVASLVRALGRLKDGTEEYVIVAPHRDGEWLSPLLGPNQRLLVAPAPAVRSMARCRELLGPFAGSVHRLYRRLQFAADRPLFTPRVAESKGFYESIGGDIIHFPHQRFVATGLPAVYNPHDLQHIHYPEFFTKQELAELDLLYRTGCEASASVAAESVSAKDDICRNLGIRPDKVQVILRGPPTELYRSVGEEDLLRTRDKFRLPESFVFYPAQTWPHKNHLRLLEAIVLLRDHHGLPLNLVCTGNKNFFWPRVQSTLRRLGLAEQVSFLGFVDSSELQALYKLARFVVFPSLFEGGGFPVLEAFRAGAPLVCSDIPPLREYAGSAAVFVEPRSVQGIATGLLTLATDDGLRETLRERGYERIDRFNWSATAKTYRALYRKTAGRRLDEEDAAYLDRNGAGALPRDHGDHSARSGGIR